MADAPLVSICIPVYNGEQFIAEAIGSAIAQGYPRLEVLVQDNASTDGTWELLVSLADRYTELSIERNESNIGMSPNWNRVVNRASGEYVLLMSADDYLEPEFLGRCIEAFGESDADIVTTDHYLLRDGSRQGRRMRLAGGLYRDFASKVIMLNPFSINFSLFRRSAVERLKGDGNMFDNHLFVCDYDLWMRAALGSMRVLYLDARLGTYRVHGANLSRNVMRMNRQAALVVLRHRKGLKECCVFAYRITMLRFMARVVRNFVRYGRLDRRLLNALFAGFWR